MRLPVECLRSTVLLFQLRSFLCWLFHFIKYRFTKRCFQSTDTCCGACEVPIINISSPLIAFTLFGVSNILLRPEM